MSSLHFKSIIKIIGVNPYVHVTKEQASKLKAGWKKPMPVLVQINDKPDEPWKINMMPMGDGDFYLYLHREVRKSSNTKVGDLVTVDVSFDEDYKGGPQGLIPSWFKQILKNPEIKKNWDALIPSRKKEIIRYITQLKSEEAIERNRQKILHILSGKPGRFMARDWDKGK